MGGFGWAVQQVSRCFEDDPALGVDVTILMGEKASTRLPCRKGCHGSPVLWRAPVTTGTSSTPVGTDIDLVLCIDYRSNYRSFFYALPRVPFVIWVRDPSGRARSPRDRHSAHTRTGNGAAPRHGRTQHAKPEARCASLCPCAEAAAVCNRRPLAPKVPDAYGFDPGLVHLLPNIVDSAFTVSKSLRPTIVSLARLDPTKRPWLFISLAKRFPDVDFIVMGQSHFKGSGAWQPSDLPANVRLLGHANEQQKREVLSAAWLLVNTSIHEGLSVSFLESLACETPLVALVDPEGIVSKFGICVGQHLGTGVDALPTLDQAVRELLGDDARRRRLGTNGRAWVGENHNRSRFLRGFSALCGAAAIEPRMPQRLV